MLPHTRVSDIALYLRCPRLVYFDSLGSLPRKSDARHVLLRALALEIGPFGDLEEHLRASLARLEQEIPLVYDVASENVGPACRDLEARIPDISRCYRPHIEDLSPGRVDVELRSDKLGLSGRLDRLAPGPRPSIVRSGDAPKDGVWKRDRLMLAGYSLLLRESLGPGGDRIERGIVEYPLAGEIREISIRGIDRARVLRIRDRIRLIKSGCLPDRPSGAPCERCAAGEHCQTGSSLASRFF